MSVCPKCNNQITEDFGLVDCSSCGTPVLIGIDGEVQFAENTSSAPPSLTDQNFQYQEEAVEQEISFTDDVQEMNDEVTNFNFEGLEESVAEVSDENNKVEDQNNNSDDLFQLSVVQNEPSINEVETSFKSELKTNSEAILNEFSGSDDDLFGDNFENLESDLPDPLAAQGEPEQLEKEEGVFLAEDDVLIDEGVNSFAEKELTKSKQVVAESSVVNITEYSNSEKSSVKDGYLKYKLFIGGIDSTEIKNRIFQELSDKKFLLDISQLNEKIVDGNLCIEPISAVKASIIINRLQSIPITIAWDQYDIRKA